jgi:hypothetical protein
MPAARRSWRIIDKPNKIVAAFAAISTFEALENIDMDFCSFAR